MGKVDIKVSIIVPIYNVEQYINCCINSIIEQTYRKIEIILVDDGSPDNCPLICDDYVRKDERIRVIHKKNGGLVSARKAGVSIATGEYVMYVDGDDWIDKDFVEKLVEPLENSKVDVVTTTAIYMNYEDGRQLERCNKMKEGEYHETDFFTKIYPYYIYEDRFYDTSLSANAVSYLCKREILLKKQSEIDDYITIGEDIALTFRLFLTIDSLVVVNIFGYHYRQQSNSMIHKKYDNIKQIEALYISLKDAINNCDNEERGVRLRNKIARLIFFAMWIGAPEKIAQISNDYIFPYSNVKRESRIFVYGVGTVGRGLIESIYDNGNYTLVGCSDQGWKLYSDGLFRNKKKICDVCAPEKINTFQFDYLLIGVSRDRYRQEIIRNLLDIGVSKDKIVNIDQTLLIEENLPF